MYVMKNKTKQNEIINKRECERIESESLSLPSNPVGEGQSLPDLFSIHTQYLIGAD